MESDSNNKKHHHQQHVQPQHATEALREANEPNRSRRRIKPSLLAVCRDSEQLSVALYSATEDAWSFYEDACFAFRSSFAAAFFNNELVIVGGRGETSRVLDTVESINLDTRTMSRLPSMAQKRYGHGCAVLDDDGRFLYAVGGYDCEGDSALCHVERYDRDAGGAWHEVAPLTVGRLDFGLASLDGRLFAVGGHDGRRSTLSSTECYEPETNKWTPRASLNIARRYFSIASGNGFLYAVGGYGSDTEFLPIERYDPQADKWTQISLQSPRPWSSCAFLDDRLLVLSSDEAIDEGTKFEEFDLVTAAWMQRTTLSRNVTHLCAVVMQNF